jgi:hypothetical protein
VLVCTDVHERTNASDLDRGYTRERVQCLNDAGHSTSVSQFCTHIRVLTQIPQRHARGSLQWHTRRVDQHRLDDAWHCTRGHDAELVDDGIGEAAEGDAHMLEQLLVAAVQVETPQEQRKTSAVTDDANLLLVAACTQVY